jgi:hypothetical protein
MPAMVISLLIIPIISYRITVSALPFISQQRALFRYWESNAL